MAWSLYTHSTWALFLLHLIKTKMGEGDLEGVGGRCRGIRQGRGREGERKEEDRRRKNKRHKRKRGKTNT